MIDYRGNEVKKNVALQIVKALYWICDYGVNIAKTNCPVDQGKLRSSINRTVEIGAGRGIVGTPEESAPYVEYGTGPHKTNTGSSDFVYELTQWCNRHGITNKNLQFLIIRHIRKHGTTAQPFLRPSFDEVSKHAESIMNDFLMKVTE